MDLMFESKSSSDLNGSSALQDACHSDGCTEGSAEGANEEGGTV